MKKPLMELGDYRLNIDTLRDIFPAEEGSIDLIYGRIGQGKTYNATSDIVQRLKHGSVEYVNWPMDISHFDFSQISRWKFLILGLLGIKDTFFKFSRENLKYFEISDEWAQQEGYGSFEEWLASRTDCVLNVDEGHVLLDSYVATKMSMAKRTAILGTRHFNRRIIIISQRPTAIHVSARGNVNRFYKCERLISWPVLIFRKTEYQDMAGETVDETTPVSSKWYFANKEVLKAYDSQYLRRNLEPSQQLSFEAYKLSYWVRLKAVIHKLLPPLKRRRPVDGMIQKSSLGVKWNWATLKNGESGSKRLPVADLGIREQIRLIAKQKSV